MRNRYPVVLQQDQSDCGVACLLSIIRYYGGTDNLENLRRASGTSVSGTTLLGLYQAAREKGFDADGCEADMDALMEHGQPCILHVHKEEVQHFVVCYGFREDEKKPFIIGDPAAGIVHMSPDELNLLWKSKACLVLQPNTTFVRAGAASQRKRRWVKSLLKEDYPVLGIAVGIGLAIAVLSMMMAVFMQKLIDEILPGKKMTFFVAGLVLMLLLLVAKEILSYWRQFFLLRQAYDFNIRVVDFFYKRLLGLPAVFFDTRKIGELTARLNDTTRIQRVISQLAGNIIIDSLITMVVLAFLFSYSWKVAIGSLLALPVYFLVIYYNNKYIIKGQQEIMGRYAINESNYISTLQGIDSIRNHNKQPFFSGMNKSVYQQYQQAVFALGKIQIRISFLANSFGVCFLLTVLLYTGLQAMGGQLKTGEMIAILGLCSTLLPGVANLAMVAIPLNEARIAFERMFEFTGIEPEREHGNIMVPEFRTLSIRGLSFRYPGRIRLLENVSLTVKRGEIIALMGENGSGKSTLTQVLKRSYDWEGGVILINDAHPLREIDLRSWRSVLGVVPQQAHLFNGTVLDNIAFDDAVNSPQKVLAFVEEYGFSAFVDSLPQGYLTPIGEDGVNLSAGQQQMVILMRALYHKPQLLILDEATAAMDRESEKFVFSLLKRIREKVAVILITHKLHSLRDICDRLYILESGCITAEGDHQTVLLGNNLYSRYWNDLYPG